MQRQTIKIPTRTHLKKFLLKTEDAQEPFRVDQQTSLGKNLMSSLVDKIDYVNTNDRYYNDSIKLVFSKRLNERGAHLVKRLVYINTLLDEMFKEALILWIFAQSRAGINPNQSTKDFLTFFDIDESEYSYAAAYKHWQRWKESKRNLKKFSRNRPNFPPKVSEVL